jgi:hypothetical protein
MRNALTDDREWPSAEEPEAEAMGLSPIEELAKHAERCPAAKTARIDAATEVEARGSLFMPASRRPAARHSASTACRAPNPGWAPR